MLAIDTKTAPTIYSPCGCALCRQSGYLGRTGVYELIAIDETLRDMIHAEQSEQSMRQYARRHFLSLRQDGYRRVLQGETSLEEVLRVTSED